MTSDRVGARAHQGDGVRRASATRSRHPYAVPERGCADQRGRGVAGIILRLRPELGSSGRRYSTIVSPLSVFCLRSLVRGGARSVRCGVRAARRIRCSVCGTNDASLAGFPRSRHDPRFLRGGAATLTLEQAIALARKDGGAGRRACAGRRAVARPRLSARASRSSRSRASFPASIGDLPRFRPDGTRPSSPA